MSVAVKHIYDVYVNVVERDCWTGLFTDPPTIHNLREAIEHDLAELMDVCTANNDDTSAEETKSEYLGHLIELLGVAKPILYEEGARMFEQRVHFAGMYVGNVVIKKVPIFEND